MSVPGWIDLQINGFKGINFSSSDLTIEQIKLLNKELLKVGTIGYCPTIITSSIEIYQRNLPLIAKAMEEESEGAKLLGIHLEGPFINPSDGPRGIHPNKYITKPSIRLFEKLYAWANKKIALITVAPEQPKALDLIEYISKRTTITVSIGHTSANIDLIRRAKQLGVKGATHVGNGISEQINRHKNPLWAILADDDLYGLFITDGFHLPDEFIKVALRAKTPSKFIVTSDLIHISGLNPGHYKLNGIPIILEPNGYLHRKDSNQLAGSTSTMMDCMNVISRIGELKLDEMNKIGHNNPLKLLEKDYNQSDFQSIRIKFKNRSFIL